MTTSSDNRSKPASRPEAKNWLEISSQIDKTAAEKLGEWLDEQLKQLEASQLKFVTTQSTAKSLRR